MAFKRFSYLDHAGDTPSPSLEVVLQGVNGVSHRTLALIDTGSEWSGLSKELADKLGSPAELYPTEAQDWEGVTARSWWQEGPTVSVMGYVIGLSPLIREGLPVVVLGRLDFLVHFRFTVEQAQCAFVLEPTDDLVTAHE
ncbi:MAG: hypothetical protein WKF41_13030 [Gaiellaceae bacterium]